MASLFWNGPRRSFFILHGQIPFEERYPSLHLISSFDTKVWHDDVIKWKHFPRYWPFVRGIHWPPVNSPQIGQWRRALMFSLICAGINGWVNNGEAGDLRRNHAHYDVNVMAVCWKSLLRKTTVSLFHMVNIMTVDNLVKAEAWAS